MKNQARPKYEYEQDQSGNWYAYTIINDEKIFGCGRTKNMAISALENAIEYHRRKQK